jgi:hypothetical protein
MYFLSVNRCDLGELLTGGWAYGTCVTC